LVNEWNQVSGLGRIGQIRLENPGLLSKSVDFVSKRFGVGIRMSMMDDYIRARTRTCQCEETPDAARRTGDQNGFVVKRRNGHQQNSNPFPSFLDDPVLR
jgi:hypothetical protein